MRKYAISASVFLLLAGCTTIEAKTPYEFARIPATDLHEFPQHYSPSQTPTPLIVFVPKIAITEVKASPKPKIKISVKPLSISDARVIAKAYARSILSATQYSCVDYIWTNESHWNYLDRNSIGAYGIPQALPGSKMASSGSDWKTNPITQVKWGLGYINERYGTPCSAWTFWRLHRWY